MRLSNGLIGLLVAILFAGAWVLLNRPVDEAPWTQDVSGLTYTPFRDYANPTNGHEPTVSDMRKDLSLVAGLTTQLRTYSTTGANYGVPTIADRMGLRVMAGAWIDVDPKRNREEIDNLVSLSVPYRPHQTGKTGRDYLTPLEYWRREIGLTSKFSY